MNFVSDPRTAALHLAEPLADRLASTPLTDGSEATARLERWRDREPFDNERHWRDRLAADGLDEDLLARLLGETSADLERRLPRPWWTGWLTEAATEPQVAPEEAPSTEGEPFLAPVADDLVGPAVRRLRADLERLCERAARFDPAALVEQLRTGLAWRLHAMLGRTMTLELHLARNRGELTAAEPAERFAQFLTLARDPAWRRGLFFRYPVLARQLTIGVEQWYANNLRLAERIAADTEVLSRRFADGADLGKVTSISADAGDQHRGGQTVAIVTWDSGLRLVYKPRSMRLDQTFSALVDWLNDAGLTHPLRTVECLDRGDYGWSEFLVAEPCRDAAGVRRFYHRQGALLALLGLLRTNDMHAENLMALDEQPVLVDLETLFQPRLPDTNEQLTGAEQLAQQATAASVLQVGLLPAPAWVTREGRAVDISGLGHLPGQQTSMPVPTLSGIGTDDMRVKLERVAMDLPDHRPVAADIPLNLLDYADDLLAGYTEMHRLCRTRRADLLAEDGPLAAFGGMRVRVLLQSTVTYSTLFRTGFHPDVLRDALDRERHFDFLWRRIERTPALTAAIAAERRDLWRNDVPYFEADTDGPVVYDSEGAAVEGLTVIGGLDLTRDALRDWDEEHLREQLAQIRGSLAAAAINTVARFEYPVYSSPEVAEPAAPEEFVRAADRIGVHLRSRAFVAGDSAQWLGLSSHMGRNWSLGPLTPDLFNGVAGVALFLAELSRATGDSSYAVLARQATVTIRRQVERDPHILHGMAGLPGIAYTFCRLADLLGDESLRDDAVGLAERTRAHDSPDAEFDIVGGAAGTIAALRVLHDQRPESPAAEVIRAAADRLLDAAEAQDAGIAWLPAMMRENNLASRPPSGFGHGTGGIAWALAQAGGVLGEDRYARAAQDAITYERSLFRPGDGTWQDVRDPDGKAMTCAWCHGAVGIGLSRVGMRDLVPGDRAAIDEEITVALDTARRDGFGISHSLCHGDMGAVELFLSAASLHDGPELRDETIRRATSVLRTVETEGWICGLPFGEPTPSLMVGLAGIGYGLLRLNDPTRVPSVLTMAVPTPPQRIQR
ncbi:type 2 lanthipeptide synthetase LanM family protein [Stackebrandtia nassauensis]|uniref:type 2 lanthipeptide synthetase LanM family protein n=1 Tax=Stackebrandtia nassauensis TaxID=283811 RepID=UPI0001A39E33|nr:type 2 lanthipeptide synthetase LanM family protein [Stackebrandtia nassauensis]